VLRGSSIALGCVAAAACGFAQATASGDIVRRLTEHLTQSIARDADLHRAEDAQANAGTFFVKLVDRYRNLALYRDSVKLAHRTVGTRPATDATDATYVARGETFEQAMDCFVDGGMLAVRSSALDGNGSCDTRDSSPLARLALSQRLWTLPHLALGLTDEPLRSMQGDGCGVLVPTAVEHVTIDAKQFVRLHLESEKQAAGTEPPCEQSTVDLFINPASMLVERVEHSRAIAEGVRYEATLEITPERAISVPAATPAAEVDPPPIEKSDLKSDGGSLRAP